MNFAQLGTAFFGAAFGVKAFDDKLPWPVRGAFGVIAYHYITNALTPSPVPVLGDSKSGKSGEKAKPTAEADPRNLKFKEVRVRNIQERVSRVHQQMIQGTRDPQVYALAREVLTKKVGDEWAIPEKDHRKEVEALYWEVRKRVRYTWDPTDYDAFQTPRKTLALKAGDCDDFVSLLGALLRSVGHKVRSRIVQTQGESTWNHIYLAVLVNGKWMPLDPTVKNDPGWEVPQNLIIRKQDFDVVETAGAGPQLDT